MIVIKLHLLRMTVVVILYCIGLLYKLTERNLYYIQVALPTWCIYKVQSLYTWTARILHTIHAMYIRSNLELKITAQRNIFLAYHLTLKLIFVMLIRSLIVLI